MTLEGGQWRASGQHKADSLRGTDVCICRTQKINVYDLGCAPLAGGSPNFPISNTVAFPPYVSRTTRLRCSLSLLTSGQVKCTRARVYMYHWILSTQHHTSTWNLVGTRHMLKDWINEMVFLMQFLMVSIYW